MSKSGPVEAILAGDRRAAARFLSRAEAGDQTIIDALKCLYRAGGHSQIIGITSPPGAGKSTTVDQLIARFREIGQRVAVIAVDPSSPFTGGAVLGDRVRMNRHAEDDGVLIRSMAARGRLGGLAPATGDALTILDAMRFDIILVETVGVGQSEVDILAHADTVVLLQTAHGGDGVQMVKAGVLEIADILVVNKADAPGSNRMAGQLREIAAHNMRADGWTTPVVEAEATIGRGVEAIAQAIADHSAYTHMNFAVGQVRRRNQLRARITALGEATMRRRAQAQALLPDAALDACIARTDDPHSLFDRLFGIPAS